MRHENHGININDDFYLSNGNTNFARDYKKTADY